MAIPFDTLKLARQFEADLVTKRDLNLAVIELKIWTGSVAAAAVGLLMAGLHIWPPHI